MSKDVNVGEGNLSLLQKLSKIGDMVEAIKKNKKAFNYNYADPVEILSKIKYGMKKYGVSLIPEIVRSSAKMTPITISSTKYDKTGSLYTDIKTEMCTTADMTFTWINDDDSNDKISVGWFLVGSQSDPSQGFGSAVTYCTRYFLLNYFQIAQTTTDVEEYRSKQEELEKNMQNSILDEMKKTTDEVIRAYIANHPESADKVKLFIMKYIKSGDYRKITDIAVAKKLLEDFNNKFKEEK